jgi:hypothetical protein
MKFDLTIEEANIIMAALGKMPYESVFQLVEKIKAQAQEQLRAPKSDPEGDL